MAECMVQAVADSTEAENIIYVANDVKGFPEKCEESPSENQEYLSELVDEEVGEKDTAYVNVECGLLSSVPSEEGEIEECSNDEEYIEERQQGDDECEELPSNDQESRSKLIDEEGGLEVIVNKENNEVDIQSGDPSKECETEGVSDYNEYAEKRQEDSECEESSSEDQESLSELVDEEGDEEVTSDTEDIESVLSDDPSEQDENEKSFDEKVCAEERQEADGEENSPVNGVIEQELDFDEDKRYPQYIPKKGIFFQHDVRNKEDVKQKEEESARNKKKKLWLDEGRWRHDRFCLEEQFPKSKEELIEIYGYDMRNKNGPPQARRQGRYRDQNKKLELDEGRWEHDRFHSEEQFPKSKQELIKMYGYNMQDEEGCSQTRSQKRNENWKDSTAYGTGKFRDSPQGIAGSCSNRDGPREFRRGPSLQGQDRKEFNGDMSNDKEDTNESGELLINTVKKDSEVNDEISIINSKEFPALPTKETIVEQHKSSSGSLESKSVRTLMFENSKLSGRNSQDWDNLPRRGKTVPFSNHHAERGIQRSVVRGPRGPSHKDHRSHGDHRRDRVNRSRISPTFFENKENHLITDFENLALHQNVGIANDVHSNSFWQLENSDSEVDDDIPIISNRKLATLPTKESIPEPKTIKQLPFFQKCSSGSPESKSVRTLVFENSNLHGRNSIEQDFPSRGGKMAPFSNHGEHDIRRPIAQQPRGTGREDRNRSDQVNMSRISPTFFENEENLPTTDFENLAFRKTVGVVNSVHSNAFRQSENNDVDYSRNNNSELSVMALKGAGDSADRPRRFSYLQQRRLLETNSPPSTQQAVSSQHSPFDETVVNEKALPAMAVKDAETSTDHPEQYSSAQQRILPETCSYPSTQQTVSTQTSPYDETEYQPTLCTPTESFPTPSIESQSTYIPPPINTCSSVYHTFQPATFNPYTESYGYQPTPYSPTEYVVPIPSAQSQSTYISPSINPSAYQPFIPTISSPNTNNYEYQPSLYVPTEYVVPIPNAQSQSTYIATSFNASTYQSMSTISNPNTNGYGYLPALNNPAMSAVPNPNTQSQSVTSSLLINPSACQPIIPTAHGVYNPFEEKQVLEHAYSYMYKSSINSF